MAGGDPAETVLDVTGADGGRAELAAIPVGEEPPHPHSSTIAAPSAAKAVRR